MPRNYEDPIKGRDFSTNSKQTAQLQTVASPVDTHVRPGQDSLFGLVDALSSIQPTLKRFSDEADKKEQLLGEQGAMRGEDTEGKSTQWIKGHMRVSGKVKGLEDAALLREKFNTEFNKDAGVKASDWLKQEYSKLTQGNTDVDYLESYQQAFAPLFMEMDTDQHNYIVKKVTETGETNAMSLLDGGIRAYVQNGQPVPVEYYDEMRKYVGTELGISNSRYNDLMFESIKRIGDEGNYTIYDTLKEKRPDGTPGMYYIPEWKSKIDAAQIHATSVFLNKRKAAEKAAEDEREEKQDVALMDVFLDPDPKSAYAKWQSHVKSGLFTKASDLFNWQKKMEEHVDGKPNVIQQKIEVDLLTDIMARKVKVKDILNANVTLSQRRYLLNELEAARTHDRTLASQNTKDSNKIFSSPEFRSSEAWLKGILRVQPSALDPMGEGTEFDQQQRASASLELYKRTRDLTDPVEIHSVAQEIGERYLKRRKEMSLDAKGKPGAGLLRYSTLKETMQNASKMSNDDLRMHIEYFKRKKAEQ